MSERSPGPSRRPVLAGTVPVASLLAGCVTGTRERVAPGDDRNGTADESASSPNASATNSNEAEPEETRQFDSFVEVDGTDLVVDGDLVYFNGSNNFWLTDDDPERATRERVDAVFALYRDLGIDLVRIWAHGEAKAGALTLQPEPGEHSEVALEHHDYVVATAAEHGIRLVVTLVDNWEHEGGMLQYADWIGGESRYEFYTERTARDLYRNHVETILTRENHITGLEWREDPTIVMWELANEPRLERDDVPAGEPALQGEDHREILGEWIREMAAYVTSLDGNHLVSTGSEGHYYDRGTDYPNDDWDGQDFLAHHAYDDVDAASFHWYPGAWGLPLDRGARWIADHVADAHEVLGKPAYLGEFNVATHEGLETRNRHLKEWYDVADETDCTAVLAWQVVLADTPDHDGYQLYAEESGHLLESYAGVVAEKSGRRSATARGTEQ